MLRNAVRLCGLVLWRGRLCGLKGAVHYYLSCSKQSKTRERAVAEGKGKDAPNPKWNGKQEEDEWIIFMLCRMGGRYFLV